MTEFEALHQRVLEIGGEGKNADAAEALKLADYFLANHAPGLEATALDVAYGLNSDDKEIEKRRRELLETLAIFEHGINFRYVPAGTFLMGSEQGDPDEKPVHPVCIDEFWIGEVPVSWAHYCLLMDWEPPPRGFPKIEIGEDNRMQAFHLNEMNKIRLIYCETETVQGGDWARHAHHKRWMSGGEEKTTAELFGTPPRENDDEPYSFHLKPMVAVSDREAADLCRKISNEETLYQLPNEAEWEKAARGALIGEPYSWGSAAPNPTCCDFDHYGVWRIHDPLIYPPNGYGLHGMCGGIWEWTRDSYDALAYSNVAVPADIEQAAVEPVLRGGSWIDCAAAVTVSFRMSRTSGHWNDAQWGGHSSPTIGFRLIRKVVK